LVPLGAVELSVLGATGAGAEWPLGESVGAEDAEWECDGFASDDGFAARAAVPTRKTVATAANVAERALVAIKSRIRKPRNWCGCSFWFFQITESIPRLAPPDGACNPIFTLASYA
jgi:hypothetical protein